MNQIKNQEALALEKFKKEVLEFRKAHPSGKLPERFWDTALQMVEKHGLTQVSQEAGVSFGELRKRLRQEKGLEPRPAELNLPAEPLPDKVEFVELNFPKKKQKTISETPRSEIKVRIRTSLGSTFSIQSEARSSREWEKIFTGWLRAEQNVGGVRS